MEANTKLWYLENFSLAQVLSKEEIKILDKLAVMKKKSKHQVLYFPSDSADTIYILKKGQVRISSISPEGKEIIISIVGPGEIFGEIAIPEQPEERQEIAKITEDALLCMVKVEDIKEMMSHNPRLNMAIFKLIGLRLKKVQSRLESLIFKTADKRIASFIKEIADEHGRKILGAPDMREVKLGLSHADIAKLTATSRQTVTTVLNALEKKGIITYDRKRIKIKDYPALESF